MDIKKEKTETPLQYHKRLVYGKLVDKTLADMDYSELAQLAYGKSFSSDVARRMFYGSKRTLDILEKEQTKKITSSKIISELDEKMEELRKERQKLYDQRREYNKLVSAEAREEHLLDELKKSADNLSETVGCMYKDMCVSKHSQHSDNYAANEAILVLSDWHYGMKTNNVFNTYDTNICKQRVANLIKKTVSKLSLHNCDKLHIVVLGDLIHGAIHVGARVASEEYVSDQLMQVSEILAQTIEVLSKSVKQTYVYVTYGNHARTVQNKADSVHRDNMERIIPWWLTERLSSYKNITIQEDNGTEFLFIRSKGHDLCASHGDNDSVKSSPRLLSTLLNKKCNRNIEYVLLGDKHHRESFEELGVTALLCGSLCGADDHANGKRLYSTPSQLLLIIDNDGVDAEYRIKCEC